jgi:hypothetical protein
LMHKKLARDENLMLRGCYLPSICNLCMCCSESSFHLFFACPAVQVWTWLAQFIGSFVTDTTMQGSYFSFLISLINTIWFIRNQSRFNSKSIHWTTAMNLILSDVALAGNRTKQTFLLEPL